MLTVVYLITFAGYGTHLHGSESGSIDCGHNAPGTPILEVDSGRAAFEAELMRHWKHAMAVATTARLGGDAVSLPSRVSP